MAQEPALSVHERAVRATVQIKTEDSASVGFLVQPNGTIVTSFHVVDGATRVTVTTNSGEIFDDVSLLAKDERKDLALIKVSGFDLHSLQLGNSNALQRGQHISVIADRLDSGELYASIPDGIVLSIRTLDLGYKVIQTTAPIPNGSVGGLVMNEDGETVALLALDPASGEDLTLAIPINYARGMLREVRRVDPIRRWESRPVPEGPWEHFFRIWLGVLHYYPWLVAILIVTSVIYLSLMFRYWYLSTKPEPRIAPISVKGRSSREFGTREAGLVLEAHASELNRRTTEIQSAASGAVMRILSGGRLPGEAIVLVMYVREKILRVQQRPQIKLDEDLVLEIGTLKIPIGAMGNLITYFFEKIPMFFRKQYLNSLIHVSLIRLDSEVQLIVSRGEEYIASRRVESEGPGGEENRTRSTANAAEAELLRDAVFMILQLMKDRTLPGESWQGKEFFVDGLDKLDKAQRIGNPDLMAQAVKDFCQAAEADGKNYEALYIQGATLVAEREEDSVIKAQKLLTQALETERLTLRALVHAGLANSYAQQRFRLARRRDEVLEKARYHVNEAYKNWGKATEKPPDAWILATHALYRLVSASTTKQLLAAARLYDKAIKKDPDNAVYYNALGYILLKLAERIEQLEAIRPEDISDPAEKLKIKELVESIPPEEISDPAEEAEYCFHLSLERDPNNKLSHANLCLLYSTQRYQDKGMIYRALCRDHGEKALKIDPSYIHGYRDLAHSLLRYKQFDEALKHFGKALQFAPTEEKKTELITGMQSLLKTDPIPKENLEKSPYRSLLELPERSYEQRDRLN